MSDTIDIISLYHMGSLSLVAGTSCVELTCTYRFYYRSEYSIFTDDIRSMSHTSLGKGKRSHRMTPDIAASLIWSSTGAHAGGSTFHTYKKIF